MATAKIADPTNGQEAGAFYVAVVHGGAFDWPFYITGYNGTLYEGDIRFNGDNNVYNIQMGSSSGVSFRSDGYTGLITMPLTYNNSITGRDVYITTTGQLGYYSSMRWHKDNIVAIADDYIDKMMRVQPVSFNNQLGGGALEFGLVAEDLEPVFPELVWHDDDGTPVGVNYKGFIPILIAKEQQQDQEIERLRQRVAELERQLAA